jgi:hypothetical protein
MQAASAQMCGAQFCVDARQRRFWKHAMLPETAIFRTDFNLKGANAMTESFISVKNADFLEKIILLAYTAPRAAGWGVNAEKLTALQSFACGV